MKIKKVIAIFMVIFIIMPFVNTVVYATEELNEVEKSESKEENVENLETTLENKEDKEIEKDEKSISDNQQKEDAEIVEGDSLKKEEQDEKILQENVLEKENTNQNTNNDNNDEMKNIEKTKENQEEKGIVDGTYYISTAIDDKYILDIADFSKINGARLQIWEKFSLGDNQKFQIKSSEDGSYTIEAVHSGKVLDVAGAGKNNGTKVQQYTNNGTDAQKWKIEENEDGTYSIISKCNDLYLDIPQETAKNGVKLQVYEKKKTQSQKFKFIKINDDEKQVIENGLYKVKIASNRAIGLDIANSSRSNGANVQIWTESNIISRNQRFEIKYKGNRCYEIIAQHSEKSLDVAGAGMRSGTNVQQYASNGTDAQMWIIRENLDGTYSIQSKVNGLYIDVAGGLIQNGSNIQMYEANESQAQKFVFEKVEKPTCNQKLEDGVYKISTALNSNMCLDIAEGSYNNQANLHIWDGGIVQQKKFELKYNKEGYYEIINVNSGKVLDVAGGSNSNGANVQQYESNNTEYQKWILQDAGDGYYYIVSRGAEEYLDIAGARVANGVNVQIYDGNASAAQKFKLEKTQIIDKGNYRITIADSANMAIDIDLPTSNAQIWEVNTSSLNQKFKLQYINNEHYKIICKATGEVLTVGNGSNVEQQADIDSDNQKWKIEIGKNGYYYIKSKGTGKYLEITNGNINNGTNIQVNELNGTNSQKFKFNVIISYTTGIYGYSGLKIAGDARGSDLIYYKWGNGENVLFATFAIHGFEDIYNNDGKELTYIAEEFKEKLNDIVNAELENNWTIYIFPCLNPDGTYYGYTNNGPGRTTIFSAEIGNKGIDMNRCWDVNFKGVISSNRNYTGGVPFLAYEAVYLRNFLLENASKNGQTVLVDLHGFLNETMGDRNLGSYYTNELGLSGKHISTYGNGYLINWAKNNLGNSNRSARSVLVELPPIRNHSEVISSNYANKYIYATINMLKRI